MFHLVTHAAFKALLFLGAGSVIHGTGTQDLGEMGGLAKKMPVTALTWIAGGLALAGVPPLAGFFSKDAVVASVLHASPVAGVALLAASLLTAFYITRATRLAFFGEQRGVFHAHEGGLVMTAPLVVLGAGAVGLGLLHEPVARLIGAPAEPIEWAVAGVAVALALLGIGVAWLLYARDPRADAAFETRAGGAWRTLRAGYGYDAVVMAVVVRPAVSFAQGAYRLFDRAWIDAFVEGVGSVSARLGGWLTGLQNGDTQWYAALLGAGVVVLLAITMWAGR
jgi:NADH-quinone oxidoreductase subunit L